MNSEIHVAKAITLSQECSSVIIWDITVLTESKNYFLTEGVMLLDNFRVLLLFLFTFWSIGWLSEVLKSQCHPRRFARLCFCFETAFCVWLARLPDFSQIISCKLSFQRADMYNSNL